MLRLDELPDVPTPTLTSSAIHRCLSASLTRSRRHLALAAETRQMTLATSSATRMPPRESVITPTGRRVQSLDAVM